MASKKKPQSGPCTICGRKPRSSRGWCARCWRLYQRARRRGVNTTAFLLNLRAQFGYVFKKSA